MGTPADQTARMLAALDAADRAHTEAVASGDQAKAQDAADGAKQLAALIRAQPTSNVIPAPQNGNTSGGSGGPAPPPPGLWDSVKDAGKDVLGAGEVGAGMVSGAIAQPIAGLAGLSTAATRALGLSKDDPAAVTKWVQDHMTYQPQTESGQDQAAAVGKVVGKIPEAADWAGQRVSDATGSPAAGAATNTLVQALPMALGAKLPAVAKGAVESVPAGVRNFASDMLPGGGNRAATRLIQQYAGGPDASANAASVLEAHQKAQAALDTAGNSGSLASKYDIHPTTAQLAQNSGLAQMDRTLRNQPSLTQTFADSDATNKGAINDILSGIAGTPEQRLRAGAARDFQARTAYDDALHNPDHFVQPPTPTDPSFAAEAAAKKGLTQDGTPPVNDPNAPATGLNDMGTRLQEVLQRPAMETAMKNARMQAANRGVKLDDRNLIQQLHYAKMDLDGQISAASRTGDSTTMGGLLDTKNTLLGVMDDLSPAYANARKSFQVASKPINQMDIGKELQDRYQSVLQQNGGAGSRPTALGQAIGKDDGNTLARSATGFNGADMADIMGPDKMNALHAIRDQLGREQFAQNAGRAVGSNTGQNIVNQRSLDNVGSLTGAMDEMGIPASVSMAIHHPAVAIPAGIIGGIVKGGARAKLGQAAIDPGLAAKYLRGDPSLIKPDDLPTATPTTVAVAAGNPDTEGHADGGSVDPPIQKSSFWDLVKQAYKEATAPSDPAPAPPVNDGSVASGSKGADFDKYVNRNVDAMS